MPMSRGSAGRDLASTNVERQSELADESGRTGRSAIDAGSRNGNGNGNGNGAGVLEREELRPVVRELGVTARSNGKSHRGFAAMDQGKQKEIASKGGRAAHEKGTAHQWSSDEARAAGRKGGERVSQNREHMSAIGRRGGEARGQRSKRGLQEV